MSLVNVLGKFASTNVSKSIFTNTPAKYTLTVSPNISSVNISGVDYPAVNEGTAVTFSLIPNKVNKFNYGTVVPYNITGIEAVDLVDGDLTGYFTIPTDMIRTFVIDEDAHEDSLNEIMTMTLTSPAPANAVGLSASVYIIDSSKGPPAYTLYLSGNGSTTGFVYEGTTVTFALKTRGVYDGTIIPYTITGIDINDLDAGSASLQGYFTVSSIITAGWLNDRDFPNPLPEDITYVTFNIKKDGIIEGNETMVISLSSHVDPVRGILTTTEGRTAQVIIKDEITWSSWTPALSTVCSGVAFTQTRISNYNITESRPAIGTRAPVWSSWTPALSTVCSGVAFTQTRTSDCGGTDTQSVSGTRAPVWSSWTPALSTVCSGVAFTQTRISNYNITESRPAIGTRAPVWSSWTPALSTVCSGVAFTQTRTSDCGGTDTQSVSGTRAPVWSSWTPDPSTVNLGVIFTQTRTDLNGLCGDQTQSATGTNAVVVPSSANAILLLNANLPTGTRGDGGTNKVFVDNSSNNLGITTNGYMGQGSHSPYPLNGATYNPSIHGGSGYFNSNIANAYLTVGGTSSSTFNTQDFTIEFWVKVTQPRLNGTARRSILSKTTNASSGFQLTLIRSNETNPGQLNWSQTVNAGQYGLTSGTRVDDGLWHHIVICRSVGTLYFLVDGNRTNSKTDTINYSSNNALNIGIYPNLGGFSNFNGYMSDLRIVRGTALYTQSTYTVPTAPLTDIANTSLLLNFTNGAIVDSSPLRNDISNHPTVVGPYIVASNGSPERFGDGYLNCPGVNSSDWMQINVPGPSMIGLDEDFTIEAWFKWQGAAAGSAFLISNYLNTGAGWTLRLSSGSKVVTSNMKIEFDVAGSTNNGNVATGTTTINKDQWYHVAVCRTSNDIKMYLDGVKEGNTIEGSLYNNTGFVYDKSNVPIYIAGHPYASDLFNGVDYYRHQFTGRMDDIRIIKGQALYTANFTPPTAQLV